MRDKNPRKKPPFLNIKKIKASKKFINPTKQTSLFPEKLIDQKILQEN